MNNPQFIHVGVGDHWVKCAQQFENNYAALKKENNQEVFCEPIDGTCVVCGKSVKGTFSAE